MSFIETKAAEAARLAQAARDKIYSIGELLRANKAELIRGSILDPINHPSYSTDKALTIHRAALHRARAIKTANERYENAASAA